MMNPQVNCLELRRVVTKLTCIFFTSLVRSMELNPGKTVENETLVSNDKLIL